MRTRFFAAGAALILAYGLAHCSFGPDEYVGPWPDDESSDDAGAAEDGASDEHGDH